MSDHEVDAFADAPNVGVGPDGLTHSDPYCAAIAPFDSYEATHGELCSMCEKRRKAARQ